MFKIFLAFIGVAVLALAGAIALIFWISGQTPINVTETLEPVPTPPEAADLVRFGAMLAVRGEVESVGEPGWNTEDGSRPDTPWEISNVPGEHWIWTPVTIQLSKQPIALRSNDAVDSGTDELQFLVRGGEIGGDRHVVESGEDRAFEAGEEVVLVLSRTESGLAGEPGWELMRKYAVQPDGTAVLVWIDDEYEQPVDQVIDEFRAASQ